MSYLKVALPKGRLFEPSLELLSRAGYDLSEIKTDSRKLYVTCPKDKMEYLVAKAFDIPTYVEYGAVDVGLVGKDILMETSKKVFELLDLRYGQCQFVLAAPLKDKAKVRNSYDRLGEIRVATKYPRVAEEYFSQKGMQVEMIKLNGSIELAPLIGLAEQIVDITATGRTLKENNLVVLDEIAECTTRLVANYISHKLKFAEINDFSSRLQKVISSRAWKKIPQWK